MKKVKNGFVMNLYYLCLVGIIALGLMTIVATGGGGGGGGGDGGGDGWESLLEGEIEYTGPFPTVSPVTYTTKEGETITFNYAYPGFIILIADPSTPLSTVSDAVKANGGSIVDAIPKVGLYVAQAAPGQEAAVLSALYGYSWLRNGSPLFPITIGGRLVAIDFFVKDSSYTNPCGSEHGQHVADVMERSGNTAREVDVCGWLKCNSAPPPVDIAGLLIEEMESAYNAGEHAVINLSLQSSASGGAPSFDKRSCSLNQCKEIRKSQLIFLIGLFQAVESAEQDVADNTAITIIAGNAGVDIDIQLQALKDQYKNAWKRIKIVGGLTAGGAIEHDYNSASSNMVFARANDVSALGHSCDGTSFAGPEVARILDYMWRHVPGLTSEQLMTALDNALGSDPKIPQVPTTGWATQDFLDRAVNEAEAIGEEPPPVADAWLGVGKGGNGSGTVTSSPYGINCGTDCSEIYDIGTVVTLSATPDEGSTFTGWSGACSGTGTCVLTMDADKAVTATFETTDFPFQGSISGSWSGTCVNYGTYSVSGGFYVSIDANGIVSGFFSGDDSGPISGSVTGTGDFSATAGSAGEYSWSGNLTRTNSSLSATGSWNGTPEGASCSGGWSGTGTASS